MNFFKFCVSSVFKLVCFIYSYTCILIEFFLKKKYKKNNHLSKNGFILLNLKNHSIKKIGFYKKVKINEYMEKFILNNNQIGDVIKKIFIENNMAKKILEMTGFNYSIDYMISYRTHPIKSKDKKKRWYANHWHNDKPFSINTLKIIIPLKKIGSTSHGGIECINKCKSQSILDANSLFKKKEKYQMIADTNQLLIFNPKLCLHRAGHITKKNYKRDQIMIQLNPSSKWKVNGALKKKQLFIEPKFPLFSYFFDNYVDLNKFCKI